MDTWFRNASTHVYARHLRDPEKRQKEKQNGGKSGTRALQPRKSIFVVSTPLAFVEISLSFSHLATLLDFVSASPKMAALARGDLYQVEARRRRPARARRLFLGEREREKRSNSAAATGVLVFAFLHRKRGREREIGRSLRPPSLGKNLCAFSLGSGWRMSMGEWWNLIGKRWNAGGLKFGFDFGW